ncbi:MAG: SDR family NAD(P)-dependent oxidoreductase [Bacteroidota bacterium]
MSFTKKGKQKFQEAYGPWAVVTGASSGIGKAMAHEIAAAGLNLILVARRGPILQELASALRREHLIETKIVEADLGTLEGIEAVEIVSQTVDVGLFVLAAGFGTSGEFIFTSLADERNMLRVNCEALMVQTHSFARRLADRGKGGIILFSSMVAFQGVPFAAHYAATKAYVQTLAEGLAVELKSIGVDVLSAAPGPVNSGFASRADMQMGNVMAPEQVAFPILRALGRRTTVFPGFLTKFLTSSLSILPRWGKVRVMQQVMGGFTAHQRSSVS